MAVTDGYKTPPVQDVQNTCCIDKNVQDVQYSYYTSWWNYIAIYIYDIKFWLYFKNIEKYTSTNIKQIIIIIIQFHKSTLYKNTIQYNKTF